MNVAAFALAEQLSNLSKRLEKTNRSQVYRLVIPADQISYPLTASLIKLAVKQQLADLLMKLQSITNIYEYMLNTIWLNSLNNHINNYFTKRVAMALKTGKTRAKTIE